MTTRNSPAGDLGVAPWKVLNHIRDQIDLAVAAGRLDADSAEERKQDLRNAQANARPEAPEQWHGADFVGELPTKVYYSTAFGEICIECTAPGRYIFSAQPR
jgi:hypothetical protein